MLPILRVRQIFRLCIRDTSRRLLCSPSACRPTDTQVTTTTQSTSVVDGVPVGLDGHVLCPLDVPDRSGQAVFATICKDGQ